MLICFIISDSLVSSWLKANVHEEEMYMTESEQVYFWYKERLRGRGPWILGLFCQFPGFMALGKPLGFPELQILYLYDVFLLGLRGCHTTRMKDPHTSGHSSTIGSRKRYTSLGILFAFRCNLTFVSHEILHLGKSHILWGIHMNIK